VSEKGAYPQMASNGYINRENDDEKMDGTGYQIFQTHPHNRLIGIPLVIKHG